MSVYQSNITHLKLALESIRKQTLKDWELLIMVDGEKGNTTVLKVLKEFAADDKRITIFSRKENKGLTKSLNDLIKQASGRYIARMDADDESLPTRLEKQLIFMEKHKDVAVCGSNCEFIDSQGNFLYIGNQKRVSDAKSLLSKGNFLVHSTLCIRSSILKTYWYDESFRYAQDYELLLRIAEKHKIDLLEEPLLRYRRDEKGISYDKIADQNKAAYLALKKAIAHHHYGLKARFYMGIWWLFAQFPFLFRLARKISLSQQKISRTGPLTLIIKQSRKIGGPTTFTNNLISALKHKVSISYNVSRPSKGRAVMLVVIQDSPLRLLKAKLLRIPIVHRLDGLFYNSGLQGKLINIYVKFIRDCLADHIIYQSHYSKSQTDLIIGQTKTPHSFILNGADPQRFKLNHTLDRHHPIFVTTGNFRHQGMLIPIIDALDILAKKGVVFTLKVIGPVSDHVLYLLDRPYVKHVAGISNDKLGAVMSQADVYLFTQRNSACPNALIEAVVAGMPVVSYDTGAAKEILGSAGILVKTKKSVIHEIGDFKAAPFAKGIELALKNYDTLKSASQSERQRLFLSSMADNYLEIFNRV